jgi:hypothetical protein
MYSPFAKKNASRHTVTTERATRLHRKLAPNSANGTQTNPPISALEPDRRLCERLRVRLGIVLAPWRRAFCAPGSVRWLSRELLQAVQGCGGR